MAKIIKII